jgi:hypothetical protein
VWSAATAASRRHRVAGVVTSGRAGQVPHVEEDRPGDDEGIGRAVEAVAAVAVDTSSIINVSRVRRSRSDDRRGPERRADGRRGAVSLVEPS